MTPLQWIEESHKLCGDFVYDEGGTAAILGVPKGATIPPISLSPAHLRQGGARESAKGGGRRGEVGRDSGPCK